MKLVLPGTLKPKDRGVAVLGGTFFVLLAGCVSLLAIGLSEQSRAGSLKAQNKSVAREIKESQSAVAAASASAVQKSLSNSDSSSLLQAFIQSESIKNGCVIAEYSSADDVSPFISAYEKNSNESGWNQSSVHLNLQGDVRSILALIGDLSNCQVPVEISTLDISAGQAIHDSTGGVSARIDAHLLSQVSTK